MKFARYALNLIHALKGLALALLVVVALPACSLINPLSDRAVDVIDRYCEEPLASRELVRDELNRKLTDLGHSIALQCDGDPIADELGSTAALEDRSCVTTAPAACEGGAIAGELAASAALEHRWCLPSAIGNCSGGQERARWI